MSAHGDSVVVRLHPVGATSMAIAAQFRRARRSRRGIALLRTVPADPLSVALSALPLPTRIEDARVGAAWAAAQLAADVTLLGLGAGLRVVLVPEAGRWFADLVILRTGGRVAGPRGYGDPSRALDAMRLSLLTVLAPSDAAPEAGR